MTRRRHLRDCLDEAVITFATNPSTFTAVGALVAAATTFARLVLQLRQGGRDHE